MLLSATPVYAEDLTVSSRSTIQSLESTILSISKMVDSLRNNILAASVLSIGTVNENNPVSFWKFNESSGNSAVDSIGNNYVAGTFVGANVDFGNGILTNPTSNFNQGFICKYNALLLL